MLLFVLFEFTKIPIICDLAKKKYLCLTYIRTRTMKRTILLTAAILCAAGIRAQDLYNIKEPPATEILSRPVEAGRIHRTEVVPYDKRHDADARNRAGVEAYIAYTPEAFAATDDAVAVGQVIDIPYVWTDGVVYLHLENVGTTYTLTVNDTEVAEVEDSSTPAEFALTPYIREGKNAVVLTLRRSAADALNAVPASRKAFENSYLYTQNKRSIRDFEIALVPDSTRKFGVLELAVVAQNAFNYDEPVTVGYDIYSPQGKLLDFNIREVVIPGRTTDTVRFNPFIYGTNANKWEPGAKNPPLYKVMLFTRRDGAYREYMPLKIGFGKTEFTDGRITRFDKEIKLVKARYNAAADRKTTLAELKTPKSKAPTIRSRRGSTNFATNSVFTSSTGPTSTLPTGATTAVWAARRRTIPRWPTNTSNGSRRCTTARATTPASSPSRWAANRATVTTCTRLTSGSSRSRNRGR